MNLLRVLLSPSYGLILSILDLNNSQLSFGSVIFLDSIDKEAILVDWCIENDKLSNFPIISSNSVINF